MVSFSKTFRVQIICGIYMAMKNLKNMDFVFLVALMGTFVLTNCKNELSNKTIIRYVVLMFACTIQLYLNDS